MVVPKLKGKKLKAARKKLKMTGCKLGKVKGVNDKAAKVVKQSPKPGKVLSRGSKVNVKLGG
jgi:beta-lactam-binding protein with PASTA domain